MKTKIWKTIYKSSKLLSKYIVPLFNRDTFPETDDYVFVYWVDANSDACWVDISKAKKTQLSICLSTGFLINKNSTEVTVMSDLTWEDDGSIKEGGNTTTIPMSNVIQIQKAKLELR